jgi:hypothetical protein
MPLLLASVDVPTKTQNFGASAARLGAVPRHVETAQISMTGNHTLKTW